MVCNSLVDELLLLAWLWQLVFSYGAWKRGHARKSLPAPPSQRFPKTPKPFAGLTKKPPCATCEQGQAHRDPPLLSPPPGLTAKRGRPRAVDTPQQYCPEKTCPYYGWGGRGNLRATSHPGSGSWRQLQCVVCQTYFLDTPGTVFPRKRVPAQRLVRVVAALAEGLGLRAVARVFEVDPNPGLQGWEEVADQLQAFSQSWLHAVHLSQLQLDELFAVLSEAKAGAVSAAEALERRSRSPPWVGVALDPLSKLLLAIEGQCH